MTEEQKRGKNRENRRWSGKKTYRKKVRGNLRMSRVERGAWNELIAHYDGNWKVISGVSGLSELFIANFANHIDFDVLCEKQQLN